MSASTPLSSVLSWLPTLFRSDFFFTGACIHLPTPQSENVVTDT